MTVDECRALFDANPDFPVTQYKNRLAVCQRCTVVVPYLDCSVSPCEEKGNQTFRVILAGNGSISRGRLGEREIAESC
ncbi:hypothetical protein AB0L13_25720 [Saccharopolyspora shandongensis]|uniref:hypothetical protein n=1 Tax=Saccharopolyspora shandongensis TaxID=418495 RepID=UPI003420550B